MSKNAIGQHWRSAQYKRRPFHDIRGMFSVLAATAEESVLVTSRMPSKAARADLAKALHGTRAALPQLPSQTAYAAMTKQRGLPRHLAELEEEQER